MSQKLIFRTHDQKYSVDWFSGDPGVPGYWISTAPGGSYSDTKPFVDSTPPQITETGKTLKRNKQRVVDTCFGPVAHWSTGRWKFEGHVQGADLDDCREKFRVLQRITTSYRWELVYNSGGVNEDDRIYDCLPVANSPSLFPLITWEDSEYQVNLDIEFLPYIRYDGWDLPENLVMDPHMCEDWNNDGYVNSFSEFHDVAGNQVSASVDPDGGQKIQVLQFAGAAGGQGVEPSAGPYACAYGDVITLQASLKSQAAAGDGYYLVDGYLTGISGGYQTMGINIGNDCNFNTAYPAYYAADLPFIAGSLTHVRVAMADYRDGTALGQGVGNMRQLALDAIAAGLNVVYGITKWDSTPALTIAEISSGGDYWNAVLAEAAWAQANLTAGKFEFQLGNELDMQLASPTDANRDALRTQVRALATAVKALAGWTAPVSYAEAAYSTFLGPDTHERAAGWALDNTIGALDYLSINIYGDNASVELNGYKSFLDTILNTSFAAKVYISEWNVDTGALNGSTGSDYQALLKSLRNLNAVSRMYHFTWRMGGDAFAVKHADGTLQPWWDTITCPPTVIARDITGATDWTHYWSEGIAIPVGCTAITPRAFINGSNAGNGSGALSVRDFYLAKTSINLSTGRALLHGNDGAPVNYGSNYSTSPAHVKISNLPGSGPAQLLVKHQAAQVLTSPPRYLLGAAGEFDLPIGQLVGSPLFRGYIWKFTDIADAYALGGLCSAAQAPNGELKIKLGHMSGRFLIWLRIKSSSTTAATDTFQINLYPNPDMAGEVFSTMPQKPMTAVGKWQEDCFGEIDLPYGSNPNWDWLTGDIVPSNSLGIKSNGGDGNWWADRLIIAPLNNGSQRFDPVPLLYSSEHQAVVYDGVSFESDVYLERRNFTATNFSSSAYSPYFATRNDSLSGLVSMNMSDVPADAVFSALSNSVVLYQNNSPLRVFSTWQYDFYWASIADYQASLGSTTMEDIPAGSAWGAISNGVTLNTDGYPVRKWNMPAGIEAFAAQVTVNGVLQNISVGAYSSPLAFTGAWTPTTFMFPFEATLPKSNSVSPNNPDMINVEPDIDNWLVSVAEVNVNDANQDYAPAAQKLFFRVVPRVQE